MALELKNLSYCYNRGTVYENLALDDVSLKIENGEFIGLIGHTGSGKSTLVQVINCLLKPSAGTVLLDGKDVFESEKTMRETRFKVGLVFQYPEHQLFEMTVYDDVCFGPKNMNLTEKEIDERARKAISLAGLDESVYDKSPIALSGGQKRRVAIAGILAMKPDVLVLDEPTAGLDPKAREDILNELKKLQKEENMTIILVSHSMDDVANYAEKVAVMDKGKLVLNGAVSEVFREIDKLEEIGLEAPQISYIIRDLDAMGFDINTDITSVKEFKLDLLRALKKQKLNKINVTHIKNRSQND